MPGVRGGHGAPPANLLQSLRFAAGIVTARGGTSLHGNGTQKPPCTLQRGCTATCKLSRAPARACPGGAPRAHPTNTTF
eukprot:11181993-Lingulodinium_polyedra.AAC.1